MEEQHEQRLEGEKQQGKHQQCEERRLERAGTPITRYTRIWGLDGEDALSAGGAGGGGVWG